MRVQLILELLDRASRPLQAVRKAMDGLTGSETAAKVAAARERASAGLATAQSNLLGSVATAASVAAPIAKAVGQYNSFEDVLTDVGLKADLTGQKLAQLGERTRKHAIELNTTSVDLLKGLDKLAEGGLALDKAEPVNLVNAKAAIASKAAIEDLSKTAVALVNNLKVAPEEYSKALDAMSIAGKEGQFELKDMARYMPRLGAQYAAMGQTGVKAVADLAAAMEVVQGVTNNSETTAAGLRDVLTKITSEKAVKAFKAIGVDIKDVMKNARAAGRPIEAIVESVNKLTGGDTSRISEIFGDVQAQSAITGLLQNYEKFLEIRQKALSGQGSVERDFLTRMGLGVEKARALTVAFGELGTTLGQAFAPMINAKADQLVKLVTTVEAWAKANPELASTIALVTTAITGLMVALAAVGLVFAALKVGILSLYTPLRILWWPISILISFFGGLFSAISAGVAAVGGWGAAFGLLAARLGGLLSWLAAPLAMAARAFIGLGAAMLATPVGWIIGAIALIAGGAYLIYRNWDRLGPWFSQLWESIATGMRAAWNGIVSFFGGLGGRILSALSSGWASVTGWFSTLSWPELPSFSAVIGDVFEPVRSGLSSAWAAVSGWFSNLSWPALPAFPDPLEGIRGVLDPVVSFLGDWGSRLFGAFETTFGRVVSFIDGVAGRIGSVIGGITGALGKVSDFVFGPSVASVTATAEQAAAAKAAIDAIAPAAQAAAASATATFAGISFHSHGVAMMSTLAAGIRAGAAEAVAAARATVQQIRDHLPHSPAKVGPLSDLDRVQFGQTLAGAIRAGSPAAVAAVHALTAGMAGALPANAQAPTFAEPSPGLSQPAASAGAGVAGGGSGSSTPVSVSFQVTVQGGNADDVIERLKEKSYELGQIIADEIAKRERTKH